MRKIGIKISESGALGAENMKIGPYRYLIEQRRMSEKSEDIILKVTKNFVRRKKCPKWL